MYLGSMRDHKDLEGADDAADGAGTMAVAGTMAGAAAEAAVGTTAGAGAGTAGCELAACKKLRGNAAAYSLALTVAAAADAASKPLLLPEDADTWNITGGWLMKVGSTRPRLRRALS